MAINVQQTLTITIDDEIYQLADLSDEVKQMVVYLDDWRQHEADQTSELLKTRAALRDIQNMILNQIQKDNAEAVKEANAQSEEVPSEEVAVSDAA